MINRRAFIGAGAALTTGLLATGAAGAGAAPRRSAAKWDQLRAALGGDLVLPGDAGYDTARQLANAQFDTIHPQAVAYCDSARDVSTCIRFAQDHGIHTAVRSGGHSYAGWSTTEGLVINLTRLDHVRAAERTVHLGPGVQAVDVIPQLAPLGLSAPAGFCATVSPGGFVTGGGTGWQYRKYGPASDRLVAAQVVLADGRIVTASERCHPDLLWALRGGGGGNFGVVTDFELAPTHLTHLAHYTLTWSWDVADRAVAGYLDWLIQASADIACDGVVLLADAAPGAAPVFLVTGVHLSSMEALEDELRTLTDLVGTPPASRVVQEMTYQQAMMTVFGCEGDTVDQCHITGSNPHAQLPRRSYVKNRGRMFDRRMPQEGIDRMLAAFDADRKAGQNRIISLLGLGKNANEPAVDATAWQHRDALYSATMTVSTPTATPEPAEQAAADQWLDGVFDAVDPFSNGHSYVNFPDTGLRDWADAYYGPNLPRLSRIKRHYDPHGFFRFPQSVPR
ncbi:MULTISPECIES: FAD-binding oxidoreductase [Streptomycetaceae]|uniref:Twin-arginine translocation pathway signal n=1 Tax=Streptantibioticus cattleyicolor (strain ATCC 35852 / DSM 46488 / JCM 4925 / NBRC 14057 / NRRL 8057) TaxID=1003195 RepID=F8JQL7_STREN|nr:MULTISPECIES: FAD-binding oxidoreductase [Streptomycetaceae]AEW97865.1 twin-arginine translocation pathway signal [Streptantibioticus cattleyicolor NRRL 8057 = DSM 46488]MYS62278.1 FAD-binding protein [Streptomyces sp. SID5468]CCB78183.1 Twin-arginine translocation pathway signal [Streptantibioticus cattleyicolor NRRL 8057 = DSM 46488]